MIVTRYGHSCLLVESDGTRVLVDPGAFGLDDVFALTDLDGIVVTHQHADHCDPDRIAALLGANPNAIFISDPQTAAMFDGFTAWVSGDSRQVGSLNLTAVGSRHAVILPSIERIDNVGVIIESPDGRRLFHPGDSLESRPERIDILAVPLTAPWSKLSETVEFVTGLHPTAIFPIHDAIVSPIGRNVYVRQLFAHAGVTKTLDPDLLASVDLSHL